MVSVYYNNTSTGNQVYDLCIYKDPSTLPFNLPIYSGTGRYIYPILLSSQICTKWDLNSAKPIPNIVERTFGGYENFSIPIPENVIADVKQNVCKIVFDFSNEMLDSLHENKNDFTALIIENTMKQYNLTKSQVLLCTGNYKSSCKHKLFNVCILNVCWQIIPANTDLAEKQKNKIVALEERDKKILCLMRLPHSHRLAFGQNLYKNNLLDNNIVSLMSPDQTLNINKDIFSQGVFDNNFINSLPWIADINHSDYKFDHNNIWQQTIKEVPWFNKSPKEQKLYLQTYVNCVVETFVDSTPATIKNLELDFSEKTFKPIATLQPFIIFGQPGILSFLQDMGYKTFSRWWDESYDSVQHTRSRQHMVIDIFKKLSNTSHAELASMLKEMLPTVEHNFDLYANTVNNHTYLEDFNRCISRMFEHDIHSN